MRSASSIAHATFHALYGSCLQIAATHPIPSCVKPKRLYGLGMIGSVHRTTSLFYVAFGRQASLIKDDLLEPLDALLDDPALLRLVTAALAARAPSSLFKGRTGIAPDRLLRSAVLKHLKGWSLRELERELRTNLVYRRFTRFDQDPIPTYATFSRCFASLGEAGTKAIHDRVVMKAREEKVAHGRKLRTDTTVVESNVHYPTDSTLLSDGLRVMTRALARISAECADGAVKVVSHARSAQHRLLEIARAAKSFTDAARERMKDSYGKLLGLARGVVRKAEAVSRDLLDETLPVVGNPLQVMAQQAQLDHFVPLVKRVIAQTEARVFGGDTHVVGKVLSLFEEHTQAIKKGKAHKPTEFGRLVRIDEVENGVVSNYEVQGGNPADVDAWMPALSQHRETFGRMPHMATADRGYFSAKNEKDARAAGVKRVVIPARGRLSKARVALQKQRWFKRGLRWRAGVESRIAALKHPFGMVRAMYKGDVGFKRHVGWSVIANNLVSIARAQTQRKAAKDASKTSRAT